MIVEDGTIIENANSYVSTEEADIYFSDRDLESVWQGTQQDKEGALISATEYIDYRFGYRFIGTQVEVEQPLQWPRKNTGVEAYNDTVIPLDLRRATMEYAYRAITGQRLVPDPSATGPVRRDLKRVGPLVREIEYFNKTGKEYLGYPYADMMLRTLLQPLIGYGRVIRN